MVVLVNQTKAGSIRSMDVLSSRVDFINGMIEGPRNSFSVK